MRIPVLIQPDFQDSLWCRQMVGGLRTEAARKKYRLCFLKGEEELTEELLRPLPARMVIVVGTAVSWVPSQLQRLVRRGVSVVLEGYQGVELDGVRGILGGDGRSHILANFNYLAGCGRRRVALYGCNPNSASDGLLRQAFLQNSPLADADTAVFYNRASLARCFEDFYVQMNRFDAAVCVNDVVAVSLLRRLRERGVALPQRLYVVGSGNSRLGERCSPSLTSFGCDNTDTGVQALGLYAYLMRQSPETQAVVTTPGRMYVRGSTAFCRPAQPEKASEGAENVDFFSDEEANALLRAEAFLERLDDLDTQILQALHDGETWEAAAEHLHASPSTLRYRLRRMLSLSGCADRQALERRFAALDLRLY